jgi:glycosyltransferase involved in cell wall biosynthesis
MLKETVQVEEGSFFRFPLDRGIYFNQPRASVSGRLRVVFFARPDMPRRCYTLGVLALEVLAKRRPDVEILLYGANAEKYTGIPFEFTNVGMTATIQELGDLYRAADVGLCFSTTNPSLVPFEMMACGLPVVDLDVNGNEVNYGSRDNCVLVEPLPDAIAEGIVRVLEDEGLRQGLSANGVRFAASFPTEVEMAKGIEQVIVEQHRNRLAEGERTCSLSEQLTS